LRRDIGAAPPSAFRSTSPKIHAFLCAAGAVLIHTELAAHQPPEVICHAPAKQRALPAECEPILA
jgi:hypothetical protein